jgi:formamidopyrimidine-DNA glycosylase
MPEGPEVWILSEAINLYKKNNTTCAYGKHLIIKDIMEGDDIYFDWSFGLTGKVHMDDSGIITKLNVGMVYGEQEMSRLKEEFLEGLGISWIHAEESLIKAELDKWTKSKSALGSLMLDQSLICGIGVAWGSEILFRAGLRPNLKACNQDLSKLFHAFIEIRNEIKNVYSSMLSKETDYRSFINKWFKNLYEVREMKAYKKTTQVKAVGRTWYTF